MKTLLAVLVFILAMPGNVWAQNVEYRWAEGQYDRFPGFVAEAVRAHT
jgi:hypothetical protein